MTNRFHLGRGNNRALIAISAAVVLGLVVVAMSASRVGAIGYSAVDNLLQRPPGSSCADCRPPGHGGTIGQSWTLNLPWLGIVLGALLILVVVTAWLLLVAPRKPVMRQATDEERASAHLDLVRRAPGTPREMVLAAFAQLEDQLTSSGLGRLPSEGANSYLTRTLPQALRISPARTILLNLYAVARYSEHPVDGESAKQAAAASSELLAGVSIAASGVRLSP
jgi:hypothetical protein